MKIVRLEAENVKKLRVVEITPDGSVVTVGGRNGQGKSSVLDAITYALAGQKAAPREPIRRGEKNAQVVLDLGDIVVTRRWTPNSSRLEVVASDGKKLATPQKVLDRLVGTISFDPLEFARLKPPEQRKVFCDLIKLDTDELDRRRREIYAERTTVNRYLKRARDALAAAPHHKDAPGSEVSVAELAEELERRRGQNALNARKRAELEEWRHKAKDVSARIAQLRAELEQINDRGKALRAEVDELEDVDTSEVLEQIKTIEETNRKARENANRERLRAEVDELEEKSEALTTAIEDIDGQKATAVANADFPVEGLGIDDDGVIFNELPFGQASQAEQLRVSVAIGLALNPELRVLLIRDGSILDQQSLELVAQMAADHDAQVWLELVSETGDGCAVHLEDGAIVGAEAPTPAANDSPDEEAVRSLDKAIRTTMGGAA